MSSTQQAAGLKLKEVVPFSRLGVDRKCSEEPQACRKMSEEP